MGNLPNEPPIVIAQDRAPSSPTCSNKQKGLGRHRCVLLDNPSHVVGGSPALWPVRPCRNEWMIILVSMHATFQSDRATPDGGFLHAIIL